VLPDGKLFVLFIMVGIPSQCTYRCVVLPDTALETLLSQKERASQCTYRCVVLPDFAEIIALISVIIVSMHLRVRGAP